MRIQVYRVEQIVREDMATATFNSAFNACVGITLDTNMVENIINSNIDLRSMIEGIVDKKGELKDEVFEITDAGIREIFEKALVNATEEYIVSKL